MKIPKRGHATAMAVILNAAIFAAPEASAESLRLGIMPFTSSVALFDRFSNLRDYLQRELAVSVTIESAQYRPRS